MCSLQHQVNLHKHITTIRINYYKNPSSKRFKKKLTTCAVVRVQFQYSKSKTNRMTLRPNIFKEKWQNNLELKHRSS